jgi:hypothetical protein
MAPVWHYFKGLALPICQLIVSQVPGTGLDSERDEIMTVKHTVWAAVGESSAPIPNQAQVLCPHTHWAWTLTWLSQ